MKGIELARGDRKTNIMKFKDDLDFYYLIGLIATDGGLRDDTCLIKIGLHPDDRELLFKLRDKFGSNIIHYAKEPGEITKNPEYVVWSFLDKTFRDWINERGITPKKSLTMNVENMFNEFNEQQKWAFLRGVLDGDGSVQVKLSDGHLTMRGHISIGSGSYSFAKMISDFTGMTLTKVTTALTKKEFYNANAAGRELMFNLYKKLYTNTGTIFLERKKKTFDDIIELMTFGGEGAEYYRKVSYNNNIYEFNSTSAYHLFLTERGFSGKQKKILSTMGHIKGVKLLYQTRNSSLATEKFLAKHPEYQEKTFYKKYIAAKEKENNTPYKE